MLKNKTIIILKFAFLFFTLHFTLYVFAQEQFIYDAKGKRNPFMPLVTSDGRLVKLDKVEDRGNLAVTGIIYDQKGLSFAITNDRIVTTGDTVGDYRVLKIFENRVVFIKDGQATEIELRKKED